MRRYFGYELSVFQERMWSLLEELWATGDREFFCLNAAPGLGKSTVDVGFAAKRVVLDRRVRVLFISRAQSLAERNSGRLRRALERTSPMVGASGCLARDFGRFRPAGSGDVWRRAEFVVEQLDGTPIEEKEPTVSAFGFDSEWLGNRVDLVFGDDLDSTRSMQNMETVERNRQIFDDELEPRLEPGGMFVLTQQRLGPFDFSAHVLGKRELPEDDDGEGLVEGESKYRHLAFKAHYEENCRGRLSHAADAAAWPEGCLLDPRRLPWRDVRKAMSSHRFPVVYQQQDSVESDALVQMLWVNGGQSRDGALYPGCWDKARGLGEAPRLSPPVLSVVTCDPSPTKYWSIQWWLYHPATEQRFLMDLERRIMEAPDFLDFNVNERLHTGLLEDWWVRSNNMGLPFRHVIVEATQGDRFMLQLDAFKSWCRLREVQARRHHTARNKSDPELGVQMLGPLWKFGNVRLPGKQGDPGRVAALKLVDEVLRWPNGGTDDCVMAEWFLEWNLPHIWDPEDDVGDVVLDDLPSWMLTRT